MKINKFIIIIIICHNVILLLGQSKIPPQFLDKTYNPSTNNALFRFIGHLEDSIIHNIGYCYAGLGIFKFQVTENGLVEIVKFSGNLPLTIVKKIEGNILNTSGMWAPQIEYNKPVESLPFIFIFYIDIDLAKGGCKNSPQFSRNESTLGWEFEKVFNTKKNQDIIITDNAYILPVGAITIMR